jgi:hypothetical protein
MLAFSACLVYLTLWASVTHIHSLKLSGLIPIGIMIKGSAGENNQDLHYRALKMALQQPIQGVNGQQHPWQFGGLLGYRYDPHFINTDGTPAEVIEAIRSAVQEHRLVHLVGPDGNKNAVTIAEWMAQNMRERVHISFSADTRDLDDSTRFPNILRVCFTETRGKVAFTKALKARQMTKIVSFCDDLSWFFRQNLVASTIWCVKPAEFAVYSYLNICVSGCCLSRLFYKVKPKRVCLRYFMIKHEVLESRFLLM